MSTPSERCSPCDETRAYDLDGTLAYADLRLALYRGVPSVQAVPFVEPERRWVQVARRTETSWVRNEPVTEGRVEVAALGVTLALDDLYAGL